MLVVVFCGVYQSTKGGGGPKYVQDETKGRRLIEGYVTVVARTKVYALRPSCVAPAIIIPETRPAVLNLVLALSGELGVVYNLEHREGINLA